jgi:hypothetical protein
MAREIKLDGGEITVLKMIGLSGAPLYGKMLIDRADSMETQEFLETLLGLIDRGYVISNKVNLRLIEDVERAFVRVDPAHSKDLRDAVNPGRRREQERAKRQRRR